MKGSRFTDYQDIPEAILGFSQLARSRGLMVGMGESMDAIQAANLGLIRNQDTFGFALKSIFCCSEEDAVIFDEIFLRFWGRERGAVKSKMQFFNQSNLVKKGRGSLVMMGKGESENEKEEGRNISGANAVERLAKTDFTKVSDIDSDFLEELAEKLWKQMSLRLKRKTRQAQTEGVIDLRRTIRKNISNGGIPIKVMRRQKLPRKPRLIILLDVSGSMDKYSFFLLRFICALEAHFERIEAFLFSTRLIRISNFLHAEDLARTLTKLSLQANNWSSGTRIGECFQTFNEEFSKKVLNGYSTTIILSDGLDTGDPELLAREMQKIKLRTRRLIWLNPLKGMEGYQPLQRGMKAALPEIDVFRSAHNLESILELEKYLLYV